MEMLLPQMLACSSEPSPHCVLLSQRNSIPMQSLPSRHGNWEEWHWTGGGGYAVGGRRREGGEKGVGRGREGVGQGREGGEKGWDEGEKERGSGEREVGKVREEGKGGGGGGTQRGSRGGEGERGLKNEHYYSTRIAW